MNSVVEIDQALLETLPQEQRLQLVKRMRQEQLRRYHERERTDPVQAGKNGSKPSKKKGCNVKFGSNDELLVAVSADDEQKAIDLLSNRGADPDFSLGSGTKLLHQCISHNQKKLARVLLNKGADVNTRDGDLYTPLHVAAASDNHDMVSVLLQYGADALLLDVDANFAVDHAGPSTKSMLQQHMESKGVTVAGMRDLRNRTAKEMLEDVRNLTKKGGDIEQRYDEGATLLHIAAVNGYRLVASHLLEHGANVNSQDRLGFTPLHLAAKWDQTKMVRHLLKNRANPRVKSHAGDKAMDMTENAEIQKMIKTVLTEVSLMVNRRSSSDLVGGPNDDIDSMERPRSNSKHSAGRTGSISKKEQLFEFQTMMDSDLKEVLEEQQEEMQSEELEDQHRMREDMKVDLLPKRSSDDLALLSELSEETLLSELSQRYDEEQTYTYVGDILIAVNPFRPMKYFTTGASVSYIGLQNHQCLPPHIFATAERMYRAMTAERRSQCCVITGESGAGKTESGKFILQHLLNVANSEEKGLAAKISQANP
eukprot:scpid69445/ scgid28701/ Unconventional myosin-XVI; Neuronal tyrosine-phosphorylated phosphoinositide-3-kinase adapter 3; Unconventional myosin-16